MAATLTPAFVFAGDEDRPFTVSAAQSFAFVSPGPGATKTTTSLRTNAVGGVSTGVVAGSGLGALAGNLAGRYALVPTGDTTATIGAVSTAMPVDVVTKVTASRFPAYGTGAATSVSAVCPDATGGFFVVAGQTTSGGAAVTGCSPMGTTDVVRAQTLTHVTRAAAGQYDLDTTFLSVGTGSLAPSVRGMAFDAGTGRLYVATSNSWQNRSNTVQAFDTTAGFAGSCLGTVVASTFTPAGPVTGRMYSAGFQGTISGTTLTIVSGLTGTIAVGNLLPSSTGVVLAYNGSPGTLRITQLASGSGGVGSTYTLNQNQSVASPISMFALGTTLVAPGVGMGDVLTTGAVVPSNSSTAPTAFTVAMTSGSGPTATLSTPARVYALQDPVWFTNVTLAGPLALATLADTTPVLCVGGSNGSSHAVQGFSLAAPANLSTGNLGLWNVSIAAGAPAAVAAAGTGKLVVAGGTGGSGYIRLLSLPASGSPTTTWTISPGASCTGVAWNPLDATTVLAYGNFTSGGPLRVMALSDGATTSWYGTAALPTVAGGTAAALATTQGNVVATTTVGGVTSGSCLQRLAGTVTTSGFGPAYAVFTPTSGVVATGDTVVGCGTYAFWAATVTGGASPFLVTLAYTLGSTAMLTTTATFTGTITNGVLAVSGLTGTISEGQSLTISTTPAMAGIIGTNISPTQWAVTISSLTQEYAVSWTLPNNTSGTVAAMSATSAEFITGGGAATVARPLGAAATAGVPPTGLALVNGANGTLGVLGGAVQYAANLDAGAVTALAALSNTDALVAGSAFTTILGTTANRVAVVRVNDPATGSAEVVVAGATPADYLPADVYAVCAAQPADGYYVAGRRTPGPGDSALIAKLALTLDSAIWSLASGDTYTFAALVPCVIGAIPYVAVAGWRTPTATDFGVVQVMEDANGTVPWSFDGATYTPSMEGRLVAVAADDDPVGLVYAGGSGFVSLSPTTVDNPLLGFEKATGTIVWVRPPLAVFSAGGAYVAAAANRPVNALARVGTVLYVAMGPGDSLAQSSFQAYDCAAPAVAATFTATYVTGTGSSRVDVVVSSGTIVPGATLAAVDGVPLTTLAYIGVQVSGTPGGTGQYTCGWTAGFTPNAAGNSWTTHPGAPTAMGPLTLPVLDGGAYALAVTPATVALGDPRGFSAVTDPSTGTGVLGLNQPGCPPVPFAPSVVTQLDASTATTTLNVSGTLFDNYTGGDAVTVGVVVGETAQLQTSLWPTVLPLQVLAPNAGWSVPVVTTGGPAAAAVELATAEDGNKNPLLVTGSPSAVTVYKAIGNLTDALTFSSTAYPYPVGVTMSSTTGSLCRVYPYILRTDVSASLTRTYATVINAATNATAYEYFDFAGELLQAGVTIYSSLVTVASTIVTRTTLVSPLFQNAGLNVPYAVGSPSSYSFAADGFTALTDVAAVVTLDGLVAVVGTKAGRLQVLTLTVYDMTTVTLADVADAADAALVQSLQVVDGATVLLGLATSPAVTVYTIQGAVVTAATPAPPTAFELGGAAVRWVRSTGTGVFFVNAAEVTSPTTYLVEDAGTAISVYNTAVLVTGAPLTLTRAPQAVYATDTYVTTVFGASDGKVYPATYTGGMWQSYTATVVSTSDQFAVFSNAPVVYAGNGSLATFADVDA